MSGSVALNVTYDDKHPIFKYSNISGRSWGDWWVEQGDDFVQGEQHRTLLVGASASWSFHGVAFSILGPKIRESGSFQITLDDEVVGNYSSYSNRTREFQQVDDVVYASDMLDYGEHSVEYLNVGAQNDWEEGARITLDSLQVQVRGSKDATSTVSVTVAPNSDSDFGFTMSALPDGSQGNGPDDSSDSPSAGVIAGAVVGAVVGTALVILLLWLFWRAKHRKTANIYANDSETAQDFSARPQLCQRENDSSFGSGAASHAPAEQMAAYQPLLNERAASAPVTFTVTNPEEPVETLNGEASAEQASGSHAIGHGLIANEAANEPPPSYSPHSAAASGKGSFPDGASSSQSNH